MMEFRQFYQIVILSTLLQISILECITTQTGEMSQYYDCGDQYCGMKWQEKPEIYHCKEISIEDLYIERVKNVKKQIYISNSNLAILELTPHWTDVTEFHLDHTNTSQIVPGFFKNLYDLQVLEVTSNELKQVIDGTFSSFRSLEKLNLSSNFIETLSSHIFSGLSMLKVLDLSKNKISKVSNTTFKYQNLLEQIDLSQNMLKDISNIFSWNNLLQSINLSKNDLIDFDLSQLKDHNMLNFLDVSENLIENITISFILTKLDLKLSTVNISYNSLKCLDKNFSNLNVQILDLSHNQISEISPLSFKNSSNLEYLHLQYNNIKLIPIETFNNLKQLKHLDISFSSITEIPFGLFNNLNKLIYLDLSGNNMTLDFHTLTTLNSLKVLKFQNNTIKNFDPNILIQRFKNLTFISLGNNVWNCSELANTVHLLQANNVNIFNGVAFNTSNILGISCVNKNELKEQDITFERKTEFGLQDNINENISLQNFLNKDFKNTDFYNFFKNFTRQFSIYNNSYANNNVSQHALIQYLNDNFTNTNFYKFLEDVKNVEIKNSEIYSQLENFFKKHISENFTDRLRENLTLANGNSTQIKEFLATLKKVSEDNKNSLKTFVDIQNASLNKFLEILEKIKPTEKHEQHALTSEAFKNDYGALPVYAGICDVLLILIFCSIMYYIFFKPRQKLSTSNEQVQLM